MSYFREPFITVQNMLFMFRSFRFDNFDVSKVISLFMFCSFCFDHFKFKSDVSADDVKNIDLLQVRYLFGPVYFEKYA